MWVDNIVSYTGNSTQQNLLFTYPPIMSVLFMIDVVNA